LLVALFTVFFAIEISALHGPCYTDRLKWTDQAEDRIVRLLNPPWHRTP